MIKSHRKQKRKKSWKIKLGETGISLYISFPAANLSFSAEIKLFVISVSFTMHMGFFLVAPFHICVTTSRMLWGLLQPKMCVCLGSSISFASWAHVSPFRRKAHCYICMFWEVFFFWLRESYIHFRFTFLSYLVVFILG